MLVPPLHEDVKVMVFPVVWVLGRIGEDISIGVPKAEFTITSLFIELVVSGVVAESVTNIQ